MSGHGVPPGESPPLEEAWSQVAERVGGEFRIVHGSGSRLGWEIPTVQKVAGDTIVTLEALRGDVGVRTRMIAPFRNPDGFRWEVRVEALLDDFWKTLGFLQDVEVGDADFDRRYLVKGHPAARVRELLDEPVRELVRAQPGLRLRVGGLTAYPLRLPPGVDFLHFTHRGEIRLVERLVRLFELFDALLSRMEGRGPDLDDPDVLIGRLLAPGGAVRGTSSAVVWDGDRPRREAAERLGRLGVKDAVPPLLSVLDDEHAPLVAAAAHALADIGDPRAVPALLLLLGERETEAGARTVAEHAGQALTAFGHGDLADAFSDALAGDPEPLVALAGPWREPIVGALMTVVDSTDFSARAHAARTLGRLGANEALPLLRSKSSAWGMRTQLTEAATGAVEEIEARASLPRPAPGAPEDPDTHPRPAEGPGPDTGTLPRPAEGDGKGTP